MYKKILLGVDNSEGGFTAARRAVWLTSLSRASLTALHVYNAAQHAAAFKRLEAGLPARYQGEELLSRQRDLHGVLIQQSLALIGHSYLDVVERLCVEAKVEMQRAVVEGKRPAALAKYAGKNGFDLLLLGANGLGETKRPLLGSVCERVLRSFQGDVWIARERAGAIDKILVGLDGSPCSAVALETAAGLRNLFGWPVEALNVYDPVLHRLAFQKMVGVLSDKAQALFRAEEQQELHDETIDKGLRKLGERILAQAKQSQGGELDGRVLTGKPYEQICARAEDSGAKLIVVGRFGSHHAPGERIGSNALNIARLAPCDVLVVGA